MQRARSFVARWATTGFGSVETIRYGTPDVVETAEPDAVAAPACDRLVACSFTQTRLSVNTP